MSSQTENVPTSSHPIASNVNNESSMSTGNATHPGNIIAVPKTMFEYVGPSKTKSMLIFKCLLLGCEGKHLACSKSTRRNLKRHIKNVHCKVNDSVLKRFVAACNLLDYEKRDGAGKGTDSRMKQTTIPLGFHQLTQSVLDRAIVEYCVDSILPLHHTESKGFRKFMSRLVHSLKIRCPKFYRNRVRLLFREVKRQLINEMNKADFLSTTADAWTSRRRSFLGVTVSWLTENLERKGACLAIRRIRGKHTYAVLAKLLESINEEFNISSKITATTTDSGSNFVKAFRLFGREELPGEHDTTMEEESDDEIGEPDEVDAGEPVEPIESEDVDFIEITTLLSKPTHPVQVNSTAAFTDNRDMDDNGASGDEAVEEEYYSLPQHYRCAAHSLNLVATDDAFKGVDRSFKALFRSTDGKLQQLFNKQSRSSLASDFIESKLGGLFVIPNSTRWGSQLYGWARVKQFLINSPAELKETFEHFSIPPLRPAEEDLVKEYVRIFLPVIRALDILQADKKVSAGFLLPTIVSLRKQLEKIRLDPNVRYGKNLIPAIQAGITKRFGPLFEDNGMRLAAMTHPRFKLTWLSEEELEEAELFLRDRVREEQARQGLFADQLGTQMLSPDEYTEDDYGFPAPASKRTKLDYDFFKTIRPKENQHNKLDEVDRFLNEGLSETSSVLKFPVILRLFRRYNTALPSSASVERLFSSGGQIFKPTRNRLSDKMFEMFLFMKVNRNSLMDE